MFSDSPPGPSPWEDGYQGHDDTIPSLPRDVAPEDPYWENNILKATIRWIKPKGMMGFDQLYFIIVARFEVHVLCLVQDRSSGKHEHWFAVSCVI